MLGLREVLGVLRVKRFVVAERSMAPALLPGQLLWAVPARRVRRGAVVCVRHPWREDFWLVKRAVGLPGERVTIAGGQVHVDDVQLAEPWTLDDTEPDGTWDVGPSEVFVLSDARHRTVGDSRTFGPVSLRGAWRVVRVGRAPSGDQG